MWLDRNTGALSVSQGFTIVFSSVDRLFGCILKEQSHNNYQTHIWLKILSSTLIFSFLSQASRSSLSLLESQFSSSTLSV